MHPIICPATNEMQVAGTLAVPGRRMELGGLRDMTSTQTVFRGAGLSASCQLFCCSGSVWAFVTDASLLGAERNYCAGWLSSSYEEVRNLMSCNGLVL